MSRHDDTLDYSEYRFRDYCRYRHLAFLSGVLLLSVVLHLRGQTIVAKVSLGIGTWLVVAPTLWRMRGDMREDME